MAAYTGDPIKIKTINDDFSRKVTNLVNYMKINPDDHIFYLAEDRSYKDKLLYNNNITSTEAEFDARKLTNAEKARDEAIALSTAALELPPIPTMKGNDAYNASLLASGTYNPAMATIGGFDGEVKIASLPSAGDANKFADLAIPDTTTDAKDIRDAILAEMVRYANVYKVKVNDSWLGGEYSYVMKRTTPSTNLPNIVSEVSASAITNDIVTGKKFKADKINNFINDCQDIWYRHCIDTSTAVENVTFCHANHGSHGNHGSRGRR